MIEIVAWVVIIVTVLAVADTVGDVILRLLEMSERGQRLLKWLGVDDERSRS